MAPLKEWIIVLYHALVGYCAVWLVSSLAQKHTGLGTGVLLICGYWFVTTALIPMLWDALVRLAKKP